MGTELILPKPQNAAAELIVKKIDAISLQLPQSVERSAWCASVVAEVNNLDTDITAVSIARAVYGLAYLGLFPGAMLGHAYFVPFKKQAQLIVGYKGYISLAYETGFLKSLHANVICQGEPFETWTDEDGPHFSHSPDILNRAPDRKNIIGAYCVYQSNNGGKGMKFLPLSAIRAVDSNSKVWASDYQAMCQKTAVLRAAKEWKITGRMGYAVRIDEQAERNETQDSPPGLILDGEVAEPRTPARIPKEMPPEKISNSSSETANAFSRRIESCSSQLEKAQLAMEISESFADGGLTQAEADDLTYQLSEAS